MYFDQLKFDSKPFEKIAFSLKVLVKLTQNQIILLRLNSGLETWFEEADFNKALIKIPKSSAANANNCL